MLSSVLIAIFTLGVRYICLGYARKFGSCYPYFKN